MNNDQKILDMLETLVADMAIVKTDIADLKTDVTRIAQTQKKHEGYLILTANLLQSMDARMDIFDPNLTVSRSQG